MSVKYLKDASSTLVREELFNFKLFYDLKIAAAKREYHLKIFSANVDFEGFDIVIDDDDKIGRYQIKTKLDSSTKIWEIHKGILLPNNRNAELMRFDNGLCRYFDCGVILMDIRPSLNEDDNYQVDYYYTDYYIIKSIATRLIKRNKRTVVLAEKIIEQLVLTKKYNDRIMIRQSLFVKLKSPSALLSICGFDSIENKQIQYLSMRLFERNKIRIKDIESDKEFSAYKKAFIYELNDLIGK
jgi:hypothetical protein